MLRLRCIDGKFAGQVLEFDKHVVVIGRDPDCDLLLDDTSCSRRHAKIVLTDSGHAIRDLASTNGLRVNGEKTGERTLELGDQLRIGRNVFVYATETAPSNRVMVLMDVKKLILG